MTTTARSGSRGHQPVARQHPPQLARVRRVPRGWWTTASWASPRTRPSSRRRSPTRSDYDEAIRAGRLRRPARRRCSSSWRSRTSRSAADQLNGVYEAHRPPRRLRLVRAAAGHGQRRRPGRSTAAPDVLGADRPAQHLHQDPGHRGGRAGDRGVDRGRHQRQRHPAVLAGALRGDPLGVHPRPGAPGRARASRSTTSTRWPASSSPASTPRSTSSCRDGSPLRGKAAVANAKMAYQRSSRSRRATGGRRSRPPAPRVQRPLWASTGTKNPAYSDVLYVETLIGPECVNTMPDQTIDAFKDHGTVARTVDADLDEARRRAGRSWRRPASSLDDVTRQLEIDGVKSFSDSFDSLLETIAGAARDRWASAARPEPSQTPTTRCASGCAWVARPSRRCSRSSAPPAISPSASCCRPSTTWRMRGLLPAQFALVGYARTEMGDEAFRRFARAAIEAHSRTPVDERFWPAFASMLHYHAGGFDDAKHFHELAGTLAGPRRATWAAARTGCSTCRRRPASSP